VFDVKISFYLFFFFFGFLYLIIVIISRNLTPKISAKKLAEILSCQIFCVSIFLFWYQNSQFSLTIFPKIVKTWLAILPTCKYCKDGVKLKFLLSQQLDKEEYSESSSAEIFGF